MSVTKIFSQVSNDLALIRMTQEGRFSRETREALEAMGWKQHPTKKYISFATMTGITTTPYDSKVYSNNGDYERGRRWYSDLASIRMPNHKPGFLTRVFG